MTIANGDTLSFLFSVTSLNDFPTIFFMASLPRLSACSQLILLSPVTPSAIEKSSGQEVNG